MAEHRGRVHKLRLNTNFACCRRTVLLRIHRSERLSLSLSAHAVKECEDVAARGAESTWKRNALVSLHTV